LVATNFQIPQFACDQPLATAFYRGSRLLTNFAGPAGTISGSARDNRANLIAVLTRRRPAVSESAWPLVELGIQTQFVPDSGYGSRRIGHPSPLADTARQKALLHSVKHAAIIRIGVAGK
jgi:hypothetical protein